MRRNGLMTAEGAGEVLISVPERIVSEYPSGVIGPKGVIFAAASS